MVIHSLQEEWPEVYWDALKKISKGEAVAVPSPHPKFSVADMQRIAQQGPRLGDIVLEHAERVYEPGARACRPNSVAIII